MITITQLIDGRLALKSHIWYRDRLRNLPTASWNPEDKYWTIGLAALPDLEKNFEGELVWHTPEWVVKHQPMPDMSEMYKIQDQSINVPQMKLPLYDYQSYGVKYAIDKIQQTGFCIIADDVGLGKTLEAITVMEWMRQHRNYKKFLLIVKKAVKQQWIDEIHKFTDFGGEDFFYAKINQQKKKREQLYNQFNNAEYGVLVTSYHLFLKDDYSKLDFDMAIVDEVHELKNRIGKMNNAVGNVIYHKPTLFLTGTPVLTQPEDIFGITKMVNPEYFGYFPQFSKNFLVRAQTNFGWETVGAKNLDKFRSLVQNIVIRRTEFEVALELPETLQYRIDCEMDNTQVKVLKAISELQQQYMAMMTDYESKPPNQRTQADLVKYRKAEAMSKGLIAARQAASSDPRLFLRSNSKMMVDNFSPLLPKTYKMSDKTDKVIDLVNDITKSGHKVIIFSKFKTNVKLVAEDIQNILHIPVLLYTGDQDEVTRDTNLKLFMNNPAFQVIFGTEALSTGVNAQVARYVINIDQPDSYALKVQRIGRARRVGSQHKQVIVYDMITSSMPGARSKDEERLENIEKNKNVTDALVSLDAAQRQALVTAMKEESEKA